MQRQENTTVITPDSVTELGNAIEDIKAKRPPLSEYNRKLIEERYLREWGTKGFAEGHR